MNRSVGIVIKTTNFSNTSQIVHLLTPGYGVVHLLGKGVWRPRNPLFSSGFDLGSKYEFMFIDRRRGGLGILTEALELASCRRIRTSRLLLADTFCVLACARFFGTLNSPDRSLYELVQSTIDAMEDGRGGLLAGFLLSLLRQTGFMPVLEQCAGCGCELWKADRYAVSFSDGGLVCPRCARQVDFSLSAPSLAWCRSPGQRSDKGVSAEVIRFFLDWANTVLGFQRAVLQYPFYIS